MRKALPWLLGFVVFALLFVLTFSYSNNIKAAASHIVISQIQISGATANDEFVELYNPTDSNQDLSGWRLIRESSSASSSSNLIASMSGNIASHKYFLIAFPGPNGYTGSTSADEFYSSTSSGIAANNSVVLFSDGGKTVVDKVGMGTAVDNEGADAPVPTAGGSIQRKLDDTGGHGTDTDNNSVDFEFLDVSTPRNSSFVITTATATATASSTATATATASSTATTTATSTPTSTPTATATASPTASPTTSPFPFRPLIFTCKVDYVTFNFGWFMLKFPQIFCGWNL